MHFYKNKKRRKSLQMQICLLRCLFEGSAAVTLFSISKMSEFEILFWFSCGVPAVRRSGSRLAMTLVANKNYILCFFPVVYFSLRRSARIKTLIQRKLTEALKKLGVNPFPDPVGHFWTPWRAFWIFEVLIEGMIKSKNLFSKSCLGGPIT